MHGMQIIVTDDPGVCQSRGSTRLRCAKTAERTKMLFGVNSPGGPWNTALHGDPDPPQRGGGEVGKILPIVDPLHISGPTEA